MIHTPAEGRWSSDPTASLVAAYRPADVFQAAALCMAEEFASDGFRWIRSRKSLERRDSAGRRECMTLEPHRSSRAGRFTEFAVAQLCVDDATLGDWRNTNHLLTVIRWDDVIDTVCATSCYDGYWHDFKNTVVLKPENRAGRLGAMCDQIRENVLPWFAGTRDPERLAQAVPDALLGPFAFALDLVEFLVSRNEREQARLLIDRVLALEPRQRAAFDEGRRLAQEGIQSRPRWHTPESLGWSSAVLSLT